jgi:hypothetical protein
VGQILLSEIVVGFAGLADIFQAEIGNLMATLEYVRAYIDILLVITKGSNDDHLDKLEQVFIQLCDEGIKVNVAKSIFYTQETECLGYILTRGGIKPQPKKVEAISALNLPNNIKELRGFLGMFQYYRDMWAKSNEMLVPLTDLVGECRETKAIKKNGTKQKPWSWESIHQQAFDNVKATITKEVVLAYPDFTQPFEIYTDASTMHLGAVITQGNRPIAFFSKKLSEAQNKYSAAKIELLAIVETLKEFQGMLWGKTIKVYTDHKNLTRDTSGLISDKIYHWQLFLEGFAPKIIYIKVTYNTVADAISQLDYNHMVNPTSKCNHATLGMSAKGETIVRWKTFSKLGHCYNEFITGNIVQECNLNQVFANRSKEEESFLLPHKRLQRHKKPTTNSSIALSAMQY